MRSSGTRLNISALTQIVHSAWLAETQVSNLPDRSELLKLLFKGGQVPPSIQAMPKTADQLTSMIFEGQEIGLVQRTNPSHQTAQVKYDLVQALNLLGELALDFPEEVRWARETIRAYNQSRQLAGTGVG